MKLLRKCLSGAVYFISILFALIIFTQCESFLNNDIDKEYNSVHAHIMDYSKVVRLDEMDIWGVGVNNYDCSSAGGTLEVRKLLWEGDSFSTSYTMSCNAFETMTTRISGTLSGNRKTLVSFSGRTEWRISNDSIVDNKIIVSELSLSNVPLEKNSSGDLEAKITATVLNSYVGLTFFSFDYKFENRKPQSYQEVNHWDLSAPGIELFFLLNEKEF